MHVNKHVGVTCSHQKQLLTDPSVAARFRSQTDVRSRRRSIDSLLLVSKTVDHPKVFEKHGPYFASRAGRHRLATPLVDRLVAQKAGRPVSTVSLLHLVLILMEPVTMLRARQMPRVPHASVRETQYPI